MMGEIANAMIEGACCSWCSIYFENEHGFPVICKDCFKDWQKEHLYKTGKKFLAGKLGLSVATEKEM